MKLIASMFTTFTFLMSTFLLGAGNANNGTASSDNDIEPATGEIEIEAAEGGEGLDPSQDKRVDLDKNKDPIKTGEIDVPEKWKSRHVYLGVSYYGIAGCQSIVSYYGYSRGSYLGPFWVQAYFVPGYWYYGYWVSGYWVPAHTVTYCYGVLQSK